MQYTKDLIFFDKTGAGYGFEYDSDNDIWIGNIYIKPVSKGLFETEKIYVTQRHSMIEESFSSDMSDSVKSYEYGYPATIFTDSDDYYEFIWDDEIHEVDEITMFGFDSANCPKEDTSALTYKEYDCPSIVILKNVMIDNLATNPVDEGTVKLVDKLYTKTNTKNSNWKDGCAEINIAFCNVDDEYSTFRRDLHMYYVNPAGERKLVGLFNIYAKSIEEDERLTVMCHNLGYDINNIDFGIFQDSDIKEQIIDNDLMNKKRKEILLEGHNIYSYIGSYKSLINAIRFFGYDNVTIKEWWKNIDITSEQYGKYFTASSYSLKEHEVIHTNETIELPSKKFKKTGKLTLSYDINKLKKDSEGNIVNAESSYKGHYYPETEEQFTYTIEEAVIKLYGLKRKLEKTFLPMNTRIIDIVGEADAFYASTIRETPSSNNTFSIDAHSKNDFEILGSEDNCFYLEDMRPFGIHMKKGFVPSKDSELKDFNTVFSKYNSENLPFEPSSEIEGYAKSWDIDKIANYKISGNVEEIEEAGGLNPPYYMDGELFGVSVKILEDEKPWIYYNQANSNNYGNYYLAEFENYFPNLDKTYRKADDMFTDENTHLPDNENIPVGALVELKINEITVSWNDSIRTWDYCSTVTWNHYNFFMNNVSRAEWEIHKEKDDNPEFDLKIFGTIQDGYGNIGVILPYVGSYDIKLSLYDWNNNVSINERKSAIEILPKSVEFTGWCKMKTNEVTWNSDIIWNSLSTEWNFPYTNNITWNDMKSVSFTGLDRGFFAGQYVDTDDVDERMMIYNFNDKTLTNSFSILEDNRGGYFWDNLDVAWQDMDHLFWNAMNICGDIPCYFTFGYFDGDGKPVNSPGKTDSLPGKWLEIVDAYNNYGSYKFPEIDSENYMLRITLELNNSNDPVLSQFDYKCTYDTKQKAPEGYDIPAGYHIIAVSKNHGKNGNVKHVGIVSTEYHAYTDKDNVLHARIDKDNKQLILFTDSKEYNPNWNDIICINNITRIPAYTDVNFNYTNCRILGKTNPVWKFTNLNTGTTYVSKNKNYHRMFKEKGCWEVTLTLNDTNNNVYTAKRNLLSIY